MDAHSTIVTPTEGERKDGIWSEMGRARIVTRGEMQADYLRADNLISEPLQEKGNVGGFPGQSSMTTSDGIVENAGG